jgi:hypothetical protein
MSEPRIPHAAILVQATAVTSRGPMFADVRRSHRLRQFRFPFAFESRIAMPAQFGLASVPGFSLGKIHVATLSTTSSDTWPGRA